MKSAPPWLKWAQEIQAIAQTGLHYSSDEYNRERYNRLMEIAAEIVSNFSQLETSEVEVLFRKPLGYATPRVDVRAAVFRGGKILLVREKSDNGWTMPGGWADVGDLPSQAVERETFEEAGFRVRAIRLIGVYDANRCGPLELFHAYKLVFFCQLVEGEARPSFETSEVAFFAKDEIPPQLSGERTLPRHLQDAFHFFENQDCPTVFD